jgi:CxxC-x17-CxxC domain-containing protein
MGNFNRGRFSGSRDFRKRDFGGDRHMGKPQMYNAVCSNCGKECQVPFKPTGDKPVYCRDCFAKINGGDSRNNFARSNRNERSAFYTSNQDSRSQSGGDQQLREMNVKLDKILALLNLRDQKVIEVIHEDNLPKETEALPHNEAITPEKTKRSSKKAKPAVE